MTILYRILQLIVIVCAAVLLWFFLAGLGDGSVSSANLLLWVVILAVPLGAIGLAHSLWARQQKVAAFLLLLVPGVLAILYGLFVGLIVLIAPDFK